ncbi:MAG: benzoyl-CoA reductase subunit D [Deltaproteobacteria bacterium]|jgi:benzoyl-CoA reductase subunit D|nr:benzoyl-CoA reductase subunit D [Deltaproteobacteria bacterium]MBK8940981.1 benzoyl-CoA reductase subunit D [Polyangiaceae bacterium]MBP6830954.1 benzoyl-CoA reductase subunit D [Deltaproteobacteria bacterium]
MSADTLLTAGIDVGSSTVKVAIVASPAGSGRERRGARVLAKVVERTRRRDQRQIIEMAYAQALEQASVSAGDLAYVASTGEGEAIEIRTGHFYGMTAHARGALFLDPEARAAIDVGSLHARAIRFDDRARVLDYRMTSQCASGTGQFLENIARYLGVTLDEVGTLSLRGDSPEKVSGICAVLAETDVINMVSRGIKTTNILRGIHESMATGFAKLLRNARAEGVVLVTGGLAADVGLVQCLVDALDKAPKKKVAKVAKVATCCGETDEAPAPEGGKVVIRPHPDGVHAGAIGAALWGAFRHERLQQLVSDDPAAGQRTG